MDSSKPEDPRAKSISYSKGAYVKFDKDLDFALTQFLIDANYVGEPPSVQVSIDNLNDNIDDKFLRKELTKIGRIRTLEIVRHSKTGQHLGLAKVQFEKVAEAQSCVDTFNGKHIMGRQLNVFKDLRFAIIAKIIEDKENPRPVQATPKPLATTLPPPNLPITNIHHPHLAHQPILPPIHLPNLQKTNSIGAIPSPLSLDYSFNTPGSIGSSSIASDSTSRQRLEDRIAILMKQPNCVLSTIVAPLPPQVSPSYSAFSLSESSYDYANSSYYHAHHSVPPLKDRLLNDHRRPENNNHSNHYQNHREPYHKYDKVSDTSDRYSEQNAPEKKEEPLDIRLTENQIEEVLPHCYNKFYEELSENILATIFKNLREKHGYQSLEKAQTDHKRREDQAKLQKDMELREQNLKRELEMRFMSKSSRIQRQAEVVRQKPNLIRQRTNDCNSPHSTKRRGDLDLRRKNRSSAYEPERRKSIGSDSGSRTHSTSSSSTSSSDSSSDSDSDSDSDSSSNFGSSVPGSSSCGSNRSSVDRSPSNSGSSSRSCSYRPRTPSRECSPANFKSEQVNEVSTNVYKGEKIAVSALLALGGGASKAVIENDSKNNALALDDDAEDMVKPTSKSMGKKRKRATEMLSVASEYRAAKRFANDANVVGSFAENIENTLIDDENLLEEKPEARFTYPERSEAEKKRMLEDLYNSITEEDIKILQEIHDREGYGKDREVRIPFGSESANKAHLNLDNKQKKHMIDSKPAEGHPKWWRGCSRCDPIEVSEKGKIENEEVDYEDLTRAPIKSHVIQAANSSRRELRGDQRRIAVMNSNLDTELIKMYTTSTLQMRVKNLRFSRSKIHKWGLFACEKIASGDAVIEYVGEKIRPSLADHRETQVYTNLPTHDGSSYFFRVDHDVIDATLKGNKARFINHSCNPNCIAKVIKHDNGTNSIVIYAKQVIQEDEEITYDYKFPREETDQKIRCNCKAPNCQKYLN